MAFTFRTTAPAELPALSQYLQSILHADGGSNGFQPDHLAWKYYEPCAHWEGSRSYVLEDRGGIVAHLGIVPGKLKLGDQTLSCTHFIDWAATPGQLLSGSVLLRKVTQLFDVTFCVGGSADNRRLLPKFGFEPLEPAAIFARPIRPFRQALHHQNKNWKLPLRLGRNFIYSAIPFQSAGPWRAVPAGPRDLPEQLWETPGTGGVVHLRSAELYEYFLRSGNPPFEFYLLERSGRPAGGLCMAFPSGQARIVDIWLFGGSRDDYACALVAAQKTCLGKPGIHEVIFRASTPILKEAAVKSGLRFMLQRPIMAYPAKRIAGRFMEAPLIVDDAAYLQGREPYLT